MSAKNTRVAVMPCLLYRDPIAAIGWLCRVLGFTEKMVVPDGQGGVAHAELGFGNGMIIVGGVKDTEYGRLIKQPDQIGGLETQAPYLIVDDADAVYARVKEAGGEIVMEIKSESYGRGFCCRDLEGHLWNVGTYDPWAG